MGFEDARNVWLEAQRRTKEEGKPVTGELVAELVGQINVAKGQQDASNQRKMRPHTKPRRWGHDSDASHTDDEAWAGAVAEEAPRREVDDTQSAVLLLAEFERLRERVKDLPQQQRERLLMEVGVHRSVAGAGRPLWSPKILHCLRQAGVSYCMAADY